MEDWDAYRLILAIHRGKTLRNAAKIMAVNHSTVARRLAQLNHSHGHTLVESTPSGYALTVAGHTLLHTAQQVEALVLADRHAQRADNLDQCGQITLSVPPAIAHYLLLDDLAAFVKRYPNIRLVMQCSYHIADIDNCEADIVIRVANAPSEHLVGHRAGVVSVNYYAQKHYFTHTASEQYTWLVSSADAAHSEWIKQSPYPHAPAGLVIDDLMVRHEAAHKGLGLIRGACYIADTMEQLMPIGDAEPQEFAQFWVLTHPTLIEVPRIKLLMGELYTLLKHRQHQLMGCTDEFIG
ncbi:LysR family transcriptional regulator [Pseudoalteromonas sp. BDTF-M6]|uniref:LysR family transcriptional regulator n=1 Tax=Pseudoalteromonas sp. BDTF-M6 TaxID=2796132 RepID=UPI001BB04723|nr:LysR family transcriptional regulator [Pseudoalteromonas sp. BDTF-M6]MBS3796461.1 LysR family transcriptional regulator [Pseudoalteromonas sp. BDTF-M6]